jgi:hypothetical protein
MSFFALRSWRLRVKLLSDHSREAAPQFSLHHSELGSDLVAGSFLFTRHLLLVLLGGASYLLLWFALLFRGGAWAASIAPAPGVAPVSAETLRARLLAVNDLGLPFQAQAIIDARNVFDLQSGITTEEGSLRLNAQRRMLSGGIKVRF